MPASEGSSALGLCKLAGQLTAQVLADAVDHEEQARDRLTGSRVVRRLGLGIHKCAGPCRLLVAAAQLGAQVGAGAQLPAQAQPATQPLSSTTSCRACRVWR